MKLSKILSLFDGNGTANIEWIKARLEDAISSITLTTIFI